MKATDANFSSVMLISKRYACAEIFCRAVSLSSLVCWFFKEAEKYLKHLWQKK